MSVRFIIGRAGSGKSLRCLRHIAELLRQDPLGPAVIWLLPRQATFMTERDLACELGGFCRARVVHFEQLCRDVLAECGGAAVPEVTRLGRQMILGHLLRRHEGNLKFFAKVARQPSLAAQLETTLAEFESCGRDPAELESVLKDVAAHPDTTAALDADALSAKLHDLQLLYKAYTDYLGQDRLDPRRRLQQVLACLDQSPSLRGATVFVDGFSEFAEFERQILARLGSIAANVEIMLLLDPDSPVIANPEQLPAELSLFHRTEGAYRRLLKAFTDEGVNLDPPLLLRQIARFDTPELAAIERDMFLPQASTHPTPPPPHSPISLFEAPSRRAEVDHAARTIGDLLRSGLRMRDIAVLVRQLDLYHDLINASFAEHDIRYFVDHRRTMAHHPLLQCVRSILAIGTGAWPHDPMMMLLKCGLGGLAQCDADVLENYVLEHRLRGRVWQRPEPWNWRRRLTRPPDEQTETAPPDETAIVDGLRRKLVDHLLPFVQMFPKSSVTLPVRAIATATFETLTRLGVPEILGQWIESARTGLQHEQASEHEQAWTELVSLFEQMVDLLGDEPVTLSEFRDILEAGFETFDLALVPPTVDEVLVGQVDRTRTPPVKAVLLLGLNEGVFPLAQRDASVLSDAERAELQRRQFDVDPGAERKVLDENLLGYIAFTRASQKLYVSRATADDSGRILAPSPFWNRLREMFPELKSVELPRDERTDLSLIATPRQLLTALMRWARDGADTRDQSALATLYQWLAEYKPTGDALDTIRYRAWKALAYDNSAALSPQVAAQLFPRPLRAETRQVEVFATCPFRHFVRYGLRLQRRDEDEIVDLNLEQAFHQILEDIIREMLRQRSDWANLSPQEADQWVKTYAVDVAQTLRGETMLSNARNQYLLTRIERTLEQVIAAQQAAAQRGRFRTAFSRVRFGGSAPDSAVNPIPGALPPLLVSTPAGNELHLSGRIDRVDLLEDQGVCAALDYSLYEHGLDLKRVTHGLSLQLLTYLLVLQSHGQRLAGRQLTPAAAFYVQLLRKLKSVDHPDDAKAPDDPLFHLTVKPRGIFDGQYLHDLDGQCESGYSQVLSAFLKQDGTFGNISKTDVADVTSFLGLLEEVRKTLARLADQILDGEIGLSPYRIGTETPCPNCSYRSICRFDPAINRYHQIHAAGRAEILQRLGGKTGGGDER